MHGLCYSMLESFMLSKRSTLEILLSAQGQRLLPQ